VPEPGPWASIRTTRRLLSVAALVGPFMVLPVLSRWMVPRLARAAGERLASASIPLASEPLRRAGEIETPVPAGPLIASAPPNADESTPAPRRHKREVLYFGRELIARAIPVASRPTGAVVAATREHPAGIVIRRTGVLAGKLHAGDVLIEAEGAPLTGFETLVSIVGHAYDVRARTISGKLWRRGEVLGVVVEPPW
jgi:S1-C subfamily serine protease